MSPAEIVALIGIGKPNLLENLHEEQAVKLIREAFLLVTKEIGAVDEGVIKVPGLGSFRVRQVEQQKEGQKIKLRRVIFQSAKPRASKTAKPQAE